MNMGMNPRGRSRGRNHNNYNNNRRFNSGFSRNTVFDSSGPAGRLRGTAFQLMEKYLAAAKDAMSSDRVLAENCLQHADHYMRVNALAAASENTRFVNPNAPQPVIEETPLISDVVDEPAAEGASGGAEPEKQPEPVIVSFPKTEDKSLHEIARMDLSVPVAAMSENVKPRRGRPPLPKPPEGEAPAPKRRGRPPLKKTADA